MKLISLLQSVVILLAAPFAAACEKDGHLLRHETRQSTLDKQHLLNGDAVIPAQESSYGFLEAFTNILLPLWTKYAVSLDNNNDTVPPDLEEQEIIKVSSSTFAEEGPIIATDIHSSSMPVDHGHGNKSPNSYLPASADADQGTNDDSSDDTSSLFAFEDQGPPDEPSLKEQPLLQANNN